MTTYNITPLTVAVHPVGKNPVFSDQAVHVSIEDEAGGPFLRITELAPSGESGEIKLDFDQFEAIIDAVTLLKAGINKGDFE